jgi:alkylation response protein AidB-like acyl-CoA dehydrogenase
MEFAPGLAFQTGLCETARQHGVERALTILHDAAGAVVAGPGGHAVLPVPVDAERVAGPVCDLLAQSGLVAVRGLPHVRERYGAWVHCLAWLRLGISEHLLAEAMTYLGGRVVDGEPLLHRQLVKAAIADVVIEHLHVRAVLEDSPDEAAGTHQRITDADRRLLRLLGAGGYTTTGPGRTELISELLADTYVP